MTDTGVSLVNGQLEPVNLDSKSYYVFDLVDGIKNTKKICELAKKEEILQEKTINTLQILWKGGMILKKGESDEMIFSNTWGAYVRDYMKMDVLPRIHVIQKDATFQRITILPSDKKGDITLFLKKLLKYASRTPLIEFFGADTYLESSEAVELVKAVIDELEYDMPHFFFEFSKNMFSKEDIQTLKALTKARITQGLSSRTLVSHVFGENALHVSRGFTLHCQDNNISIALRAGDTTKELNKLRTVQGIHLFWVTTPGTGDTLKKLSNTPYYTLVEQSNPIGKNEFDTILQSNRLFFLEDDMYRVQRAMQKSYLPLTDCGAGKRKIAVTVDGNVYPCADAARHGMYCMGNLRDDSVSTVLKSDNLRKVRETIVENFEKCAEKCCLAYFCSGCIMKNRCSTKKEMLDFFLHND
jgi:radical SAM protein with 4Fe4S-binding SPASM domain